MSASDFDITTEPMRVEFLPAKHRWYCDCCHQRRAIGAASSSLGAVSFAYCERCLSYGAEPEGMFRYVLDMTNGDVSDHVRGLTTFVRGRYVSWDEWVSGKTPDPFWMAGASAIEAEVHNRHLELLDELAATDRKLVERAQPPFGLGDVVAVIVVLVGLGILFAVLGS